MSKKWLKAILRRDEGLWRETVAMAEMRARGRSYRRIAMRFNRAHSTIRRRVMKYNAGLYIRQRVVNEKQDRNPTTKSGVTVQSGHGCICMENKSCERGPPY